MLYSETNKFCCIQSEQWQHVNMSTYQHVNMFQVLVVKLDTKLKSPDSSFTCITLECYSILLLAHYSVIYSWCPINYVHIAKIKKLFFPDWIYRFLTTLFFISKSFLNFLIWFFYFKQRRVWEQNRVRYFLNNNFHYIIE